ncbi:unnamed protein product [Arctia plantaginis]|uniref:Uncharacterized protein n=1 Tax=Arctia plantaginis TaxID=874455 RepID=A0A8S1AJ44_ARCPL|nr:unnamed protein product [Arctia plantaginis]
MTLEEKEGDAMQSLIRKRGALKDRRAQALENVEKPVADRPRVANILIKDRKEKPQASTSTSFQPACLICATTD